MEGSNVDGGGGAGGATAAAAGFANNSSATSAMLDGPAPKRARLATANDSVGASNTISSVVDTSSHPSADEEKVRLTVWGCSDQITDDHLVASLQSMTTTRANFSGDVSTVDRSYAGKAIVVLTGRNAHRAALFLSNLPHGPNLGVGPNQYPWRNVGEHHREWHCPRLSCAGLEEADRDRPNIDESNGRNRSSARCRGCGGSRPPSLLHGARIWEQDLVQSLEEDRRRRSQQQQVEEDELHMQTLIDMYMANDQPNGNSTEWPSVDDASSAATARTATALPTSTGTVAATAPSRPSIDERSSAAAGAARPVTPSNNVVSAPTSSRTLTGSKAQFAIWNAARRAAGILVDQPSASDDGLLSSSKFFLNRTKDDLSALLPSLPHRRIWAFDTNPKNGAKGWMWTDCIETFVDAYLQIDAKDRHAYEVVQQNVPCRMAFDLDMYTGDGVNDDKDDKRMAAEIIKETHRLIEDNWPNDGTPQFKDEVLVAHGPMKRSCHIIVKTYDADGKEVLLKDFSVSKILAIAVNDNLGDAILVDRRPGHGGKASPEPASFIDLAIYTKDRPFRLVYSSKITSPDRPFVDAMKRQFSFGDERDDKTAVVDTLIVPHNASEMQTIEIKVDNDDDEDLDGKEGTSVNQNPPNTDNDSGLASRIGGVVNCLLSWGSRKTDENEQESNEMSIPSPTDNGPSIATPEGTNPNDDYPEDEYPLLDFGKEVVAKKSLGHDIPRPFRALVPWVERLAADLPGAMRSGRAISCSHYEYSEKEAYVHFTLNRGYASYCHCIGRPHSEQNIMISVDMFGGIAYQRCWDRSCRDSETKGSAKHILSCQPPAGSLPTKDALDKFDAEAGLSLV